MKMILLALTLAALAVAHGPTVPPDPWDVHIVAAK